MSVVVEKLINGMQQTLVEFLECGSYEAVKFGSMSPLCAFPPSLHAGPAGSWPAAGAALEATHSGCAGCGGIRHELLHAAASIPQEGKTGVRCTSSCAWCKKLIGCLNGRCFWTEVFRIQAMC